MKFTIERDSLLEQVNHVASAASGKTLPILECIKVTVMDEQLRLTAGNMEKEITATMPCEMSETGSICVSAERLAKITKSARKNTHLSFFIKNGQLVIKQKRILQKLKILPADDYPLFADNDNTVYFLDTFSSKVLLDMIEKTEKFQAKNDIRHFLNGTCFELEKNRLTLAATNGHSLSVVDDMIDCSQDEMSRVIVPESCLSSIKELLGQEDTIQMQISDSYFKLWTDRLELKTKLIDANFPNYQRSIPAIDYCISTVTIKRLHLLDALTRAQSIVTEPVHAAVRLSCEQNHLVVSTINSDHEESIEPVDIELSGALFEVGVNVNYMKNAMSVIKSEQVLLRYTDSNRGLLVTPPDDEFTIVIMPIRI